MRTSHKSPLLVSSMSALVLVATASPPPAPLRFELANGLRVWVQEDHTRPVALVQVAYKVGAINEDPGTTGTAHYVEHMVYRATEHIRNEDVYGYNDRIGGRWTGGTSRDNTTYGETVPAWALEDAIRVTAERMGRALFDSTEFERERNNVVTEANGFSRVDPLNAFRDAVMLTSFELHPYRYSSNTWSQDNLAITRADAFDFYKHYYGPNNAVLTIVGDVKPDDVRALVERHFGPLARAPRSGEVRIVEPPQRVEKRVTLHYSGDRQQFEIVYRAPQAAHRDYPTLVVLDRLLAPRLRRAATANGGGDVTTSHMATPYPFVYRISFSADGGTDGERLIAAVQAEIERLTVEEVPTAELAAARVAPPSQGRGGRGRTGTGAGGGGGSGGSSGAPNQTAAVPPRQSNLTQIANDLTSRETFSWEVSADVRDRIERAQQAVTAADIAAYVDRWLRPSQRTVGALVPRRDDFMPQWSNGRPLVGDRLEVPPLTTLPAKRTRPQPVPSRALEPLASLTLQTGRRALENGVVIRAAHTDGAAVSIQVRVAFGGRPESTGDAAAALLAARYIASDSGLRALGARTTTASLANDRYFDIRVRVPADSVPSSLETLVRALRPRSFDDARVNAARLPPAEVVGGRGRGGGGGGGGDGVNAESRRRVLAAVAPAWRLADPSADALARVSAADLAALLAREVHGGAMTVSLAGPMSTNLLLESASRAFGSLPAGRRVLGGFAPGVALASGAPAPAPRATDERIAVATETQVTVLAGLPGASGDSPDRRALELLNYIAGVPSYGGRLGWALTKGGLTYSSTATTTFGAIDGAGHILFSTKCDTRNLDATVQAIREVIAGIADHGVDDWEVREAQAFTLGRMVLYGAREDSGEEAIATALADSEYFGTELLDLPAWSRAYLAVTRDQINAAARRYYRPDMLTVVAIGAVPGGTHTSPFAAGTFRALFEP